MPGVDSQPLSRSSPRSSEYSLIPLRLISWTTRFHGFSCIHSSTSRCGLNSSLAGLGSVERGEAVAGTKPYLAAATQFGRAVDQREVLRATPGRATRLLLEPFGQCLTVLPQSPWARCCAGDRCVEAAADVRRQAYDRHVHPCEHFELGCSDGQNGPPFGRLGLACRLHGNVTTLERD